MLFFFLSVHGSCTQHLLLRFYISLTRQCVRSSTESTLCYVSVRSTSFEVAVFVSFVLCFLCHYKREVHYLHVHPRHDTHSMHAEMKNIRSSHANSVCSVYIAGKFARVLVCVIECHSSRIFRIDDVISSNQLLPRYCCHWSWAEFRLMW